MGFDGLRQSYHGLALLHCSQHDGSMHADAWPQCTLFAVSLMDAWRSPGSDCSGESQGAVLPANVSGYIGALSVLVCTEGLTWPVWICPAQGVVSRPLLLFW